MSEKVEAYWQLLGKIFGDSQESIEERIAEHDRRIWELALKTNALNHQAQIAKRGILSELLGFPEPNELQEKTYDPGRWYWDTATNQAVYVVRFFEPVEVELMGTVKMAEVRYFDPTNSTYLGVPAGQTYIDASTLVQIQPSMVFDL